MDFFAAQDRARARTHLLVAYFVAGVSGLVVMLYLAVMVIFDLSRSEDNSVAQNWWQPDVFGIVTAATLAIVGGACLMKVVELSAGGGAVARSLGATPLPAQSADLTERRLRNLVEEMALASGLPVPEIFILEENGINAFAAGLRPEDAAVTVTRGALRKLSRDELQGVIGHEFSHILNGDMRLNLQLIGAVFGLFVLMVIGRELLRAMGHSRGRGRGKDPRGLLILLGFALMGIGYLGVIFGRLIQAAVSRQREHLADAAAVQFTRNPAGLAGALKKIGAAGSQIENPHAQETAHLFFAPALSTVFATHPPLEQRIRELEPQWDGKFITVELPPEAPAPPPVLRTPSPIAADALLAPAGVVAAVVLADIHDWREALPSSIQQALAGADGCRALALAIALSDNPAERTIQLRSLQEQGEPVAGLVMELAADVAEVPAGRRLPLLELAFAGLAGAPEPLKNSLLARLRELTNFDRQPDWHGFALWRVAEYRLRPRPPRRGPANPGAYRDEVSVLLSTLAALSTSSDAEAQPVFQRGLEQIPELAGQAAMTTRENITIEKVQAVCLRLEGAPFVFKKQVLEAAAAVVQADGFIAPEEAEMLRALAASFGCPLPPG